MSKEMAPRSFHFSKLASVIIIIFFLVKLVEIVFGVEDQP